MNKQDTLVSKVLLESRVFRKGSSPPDRKLIFGDKAMTVFLQPEDDSGIIAATTYIENMPHGITAPNETTILYRATQKLLQKYSNHYNRNIRYIFQTSNPRLKAWAQTHGTAIFQWESCDAKEPDAEAYECIFTPSEQS